MLNIPSYVEDPSYRYKMPRLQTRIEGRGNGIKTALPNMFDVARYLRVPVEFPTKYFGCELGAQSMISEDRAIVNGAHTQETMQEQLDRFIDKYVLCPKCKLPEITMEITKKKFIEAKCAACGWAGPLDNVHKVATFITNHADLLKNPKTANTQDITQDASVKARKKDATAVKPAKTKKDVAPVVEDGQPDASVPVESLTVEANFDLIKTELIEPLAALMPKLSAAELAGEMKKRQQALQQAHALACTTTVRLFVSLSLFFNAEITGKSLQDKMADLRRVVAKSTTEETLRAFELFFWKSPEISMRDYPMILKALFDADWVSEKSLLKRYDASKRSSADADSLPGFDQAKKRAAPFVDWLKNASSDEEEDDD